MLDIKLLKLLKKKYEEQQITKSSVNRKRSDMDLNRGSAKASSNLKSKLTSRTPVKSLTFKNIVNQIKVDNNEEQEEFSLSKSLKFQKIQTESFRNTISPFQRLGSGKISNTIFGKLESENKHNSGKSTSLNESNNKLSRQNSSQGSNKLSYSNNNHLESPNRQSHNEDKYIFELNNFVNLEYLKNFTVIIIKILFV